MADHFSAIYSAIRSIIRTLRAIPTFPTYKLANTRCDISGQRREGLGSRSAGTYPFAAISRVLAQGPEDIGPMELARGYSIAWTGSASLGLARWLRTEVIGSHAAATLNSFKEAGLEGVKVKAEFATAGDNKVCPQCSDLEGKVFTMEKAEGLIPVRPN